jgi:hypothetical protein
MVQCHPSPLHHLLNSFNVCPGELETICPAYQKPGDSILFTTEIADSQEENKVINTVDNAKVYADWSGIEGNAGASAVLYCK